MSCGTAVSLCGTTPTRSRLPIRTEQSSCLFDAETVETQHAAPLPSQLRLGGEPQACARTRRSPKAAVPEERTHGTRTGSWFTICGSYENTSRLAGSTLTLSQFTSPRVGWWSPNVSTRVKLVTRFPVLSNSGLSTRK